jgi:hypothetical protein
LDTSVNSFSLLAIVYRLEIVWLGCSFILAIRFSSGNAFMVCVSHDWMRGVLHFCVRARVGIFVLSCILNYLHFIIDHEQLDLASLASDSWAFCHCDTGHSCICSWAFLQWLWGDFCICGIGNLLCIVGNCAWAFYLISSSVWARSRPSRASLLFIFLCLHLVCVWVVTAEFYSGYASSYMGESPLRFPFGVLCLNAYSGFCVGRALYAWVATCLCARLNPGGLIIVRMVFLGRCVPDILNDCPG